MVAPMRFTKDLCRLLGLGVEDPVKQEQEQMDCGGGGVLSSQRAKSALVSQDRRDGRSVLEEMNPSEEGLSEEERARRRAERRRAKKKRQRERKKLEQEGRSKISEENDGDDDDDSAAELENGEERKEGAPVCFQPADSPLKAAVADTPALNKVSEEEPQWDTSSAFVANAASHIKPKNKTKHGQGSKDNKENESRSREVNDIDSAASFAQKGIEFWQQEQYSEAVSMFTEAIRRHPKDHRFFGNRSCCYWYMEQYPSSLVDAEMSIDLAPEIPKGYFRKGRALMGMKRYKEAEEAMQQVLQLEDNCNAQYELTRCRILQLVDLGFEESQSEELIEKYSTVQNVLASPEAASVVDLNSLQELSGNPCPSLWVGNVTAGLTEKHLRDLFRPYGEIESIRVLQERFCAFVNFRNANMAALAKDKLQGVEIENTRLVIRYPDRWAQRVPLSPHRTAAYPTPQQNAVSGAKKKGPINGDECYYWRTTGCHFGNKCHYKHVPEQRGRDRKPWQPH